MVDQIRFNRYDVPARVWEAKSKGNITKKFYEELENKIQSWENIVITVIGPSGSGKSLAALLICKKIAELGHIKFIIKEHVTGFNTDTAAMISKAKPNTVLLQDEMTKSFGVGSRTSQWSLANQIKTVMRFQQIHLVAVGVELATTEIPPAVINYILITKKREVDPLDPKKTRLINLELWIKTLSSIQLGDWLPLGRIILKVTEEDDKFIQEYLKLVKTPVVDAFQKEFGAPQLVAQARLKEAVNSGLPMSETVGAQDFGSVLEQLAEEKAAIRRQLSEGLSENEEEIIRSEKAEENETEAPKKETLPKKPPFVSDSQE